MSSKNAGSPSIKDVILDFDNMTLPQRMVAIKTLWFWGISMKLWSYGGWSIAVPTTHGDWIVGEP